MDRKASAGLADPTYLRRTLRNARELNPQGVAAKQARARQLAQRGVGCQGYL